MAAHISAQGTERRGTNLNSSYGASASKPEWAQWRPSVFDFKRYSGRSSCPTCRGTGRIPKDHEDELVALIPYKDKRLKPQRKCLFVCVSLVLLLVLVGLATTLMVVLFPRHVDVVILGINATKSWGLDDHTDSVILEMEIPLSIWNNNFFSVYVSKFQISLASTGVAVGSINLQPFSLSPRAQTPVTVYQNATFSDGIAKRVQVICTSKNWNSHNIYTTLDIEVSYNYLSQGYDSFVTNGSYVNCELNQIMSQ